MKKLNKNEFKLTFIGCVAMVVCAAIILITLSASFSKLTETNNAVSQTLGNSNTSSENVNSGSYYDNSASENSVSSDNSDNSSPTPGTQDESVIPNNDISDNNNENAPADSAPDGTDEIVSLFNTSVNKIKPTAKKVVKNYEKRTFHEDKTDIPDAIESVAEGMVSSMMGDDTEPIVYATKEEIKANFIVPEQSYSSKLESSWVKNASCKDNGKEYIIHIELKDHKNPTAGQGVGAVCDVIETHEVANKVSFVKEFSTLYYNCEIVATIDKTTGSITHIVYTTPLLLNMTVNLLGTHTGVIAFTFEKDYTVTY